MITKKQIKTIFSSTEHNYELSWKTLRDLKKGSVNISDYAQFQHFLGVTLYQLQDVYNKVCQEEKFIISKKSKYSYSWFKNRLKTLANYKEAIKKLTNVGKCLGDAFVYSFYIQEQEQLKEHLTHSKIPGFTTGVGGNGELTFIQNPVLLKGHFTIYHGITNILRIGDVSFFNLKTGKLSSIGELKSEKIGKEIKIHVIMIGPKDRDVIKNMEVSDTEEKVNYFDNDRLNRQIKEIKKSLQHYSQPKLKHAEFKYLYDYKDLENLVKECLQGKTNSKKVSEGSVYVCGFSKAKNFYEKFLLSKNVNFKDETFSSEFKKTINKESKYNFFSMDAILYSPNIEVKITPGFPPLFWSRFSLDTLKKIYFGDVFIISIFNPVHFFSELEKRGFEIDNNKGWIIRKSYEDRKITIPTATLQFFFRLIQCHLYTEHTVINLIEKFITEVSLKEKKAQFTEARLNITQYYH